MSFMHRVQQALGVGSPRFKWMAAAGVLGGMTAYEVHQARTRLDTAQKDVQFQASEVGEWNAMVLEAEKKAALAKQQQMQQQQQQQQAAKQ